MKNHSAASAETVSHTDSSDALCELAEYLRTISDTHRLQILSLLRKGERCVCEIYEALQLPQNLTSHHLKVLREAGLVVARRDGRWVHYGMNPGAVGRLSALLEWIVTSEVADVATRC